MELFDHSKDILYMIRDKWQEFPFELNLNELCFKKKNVSYLLVENMSRTILSISNVLILNFYFFHAQILRYRTIIVALNYKWNLNRIKCICHLKVDASIIPPLVNTAILDSYGPKWPLNLANILNLKRANKRHQHISHGIIHDSNWKMIGWTILNWHRTGSPCEFCDFVSIFVKCEICNFSLRFCNVEVVHCVPFKTNILAKAIHFWKREHEANYKNSKWLILRYFLNASKTANKIVQVFPNSNTKLFK